VGNGEAVTFVLDTVVCLLVNTGDDIVVLDLSDTGFVVGLNVDDVVVFDTVLCLIIVPTVCLVFFLLILLINYL
jgi:hypothetical protein